jgi:hypothetical protein
MINPLHPSLFREAARRIAQGETHFACCALDEASEAEGIHFHADSPACLWFADVFKPRGAYANSPWYSSQSDGCEYSTYARDQMARSLGLLLAAELIEEGFEP